MKTIITDLSLLQEPVEPVLLADSKGANIAEALDIIKAIKETMEANQTYLALSAPQIGIKKRVFCIRFSDSIKAFVNPIITKKADFKISHETCASMPNQETVIVRPEDITVIYYNDQVKYEENKLLGQAARLFDQQAQFLDGIIPSDLGLVSNVDFDGTLATATEEELIEIKKFYKKYIETKLQGLQNSINADEQLAAQYKRLKFTEDVITGRTQVIEQPPKLNHEQRRTLQKQQKARERKIKLTNQPKHKKKRGNKNYGK